MDTKLSTANFTFTFEGEKEIDASILASGLNALNSLVLETQQTCYPDATCNLRVKASREGSFEVDLSVLALTAVSMFSLANIEYATGIAKLILQFFDIKKHIRDKQPIVTQEADKTVVVNADGAPREYSKGAYSFFKNAKIEHAIVQIVEAGSQTDTVTGMRIETEDGQRVAIDEAEFRRLAVPIVADIGTTTQAIPSTDTFYVKQATFIGDSQWVFVKERPFHAKILDTEWLDDYKKGKHPIVPGVSIRAEMLTVLQIGENGLPVEGKATHEITKVLNVLYPEDTKQIEL